MKEELHAAIIRTGQMLRSAEGEKYLQPLASVMKTHLDRLISIAIGELEREMEGFVDSPVSYSLPPGIVETVTAGENTKSQLPQDSKEAFAKAVEYAKATRTSPNSIVEVMGWRVWDGNNLPGDKQLVQVRRRNGKVEKAHAYVFNWGEFGDDLDIIAWRPA